MSRWGVASDGCKSVVKELPLKGTGAARCRPPRGQAWLRGDTVSSDEADFDLRETSPLPRNILHTCRATAYEYTGQPTDLTHTLHLRGHRVWLFSRNRPQVF